MKPRSISVYLPQDILDEVLREAKRQERSVSWLFGRAWELARGEIALFPDVPAEPQ